MTVISPLQVVLDSIRDAVKLKFIESHEETIIDIRRDTEEHSILQDVKGGLRPDAGKEKTLPTLLLYDVDGLKLFEKITYLDEYYLTNAEIEVLETYADNIADRIKPNSIVVELGSGNLRKIEILLKALDKAEKVVEYYALDLSLAELQRTLSAVPRGKFKHVKCYGLHGTYDDGLEWLKSSQMVNRPKSILSMGSSVGNFTKPDAADFLKKFAEVLQPGDTLLIGIDGCKDPTKVFHAYNDVGGVTHDFILNGLTHANKLLGSDGFDLDQWKVIGEYDELRGRHVAFVAPKQDVTVDGITIAKDEVIQIEESNKYSPEETNQLFRGAGLVQGPRWANQQGDYALHMAYRPTFEFSSKPEDYAADPVPGVSDWDSLWAVWDTLTRQMIPKDELLSKPIKLRNACIFYLGHIPTFVDLHLSRATGEFSKELESYQKIFERGIDPDVENPELCHDHSEIPESWPPVEEILAYQETVREKVKSLFSSGAARSNPAVRKALWLGFEHEAMHLETLLYMLIQSEKSLPPHGVVVPDFRAMANEAKAKTVKNEWFKIPTRKVSIGLDDLDSDTTTEHYFGWDNEKPSRTVTVGSFSAQGRPITNREYAHYLEQSGIKDLPASWIKTKIASERINGRQNGNATNGLNGHVSFVDDKAVRTVFGAISLQLALDWPVMASYNELAGYANWMGGRIPTMEEVRSIYEYVEDHKNEQFEKAIGRIIPAVNSHLVNDGVEETPPSNGALHHSSSIAARPSPSDLFVNLKDANVGFKHWHPVPVTTFDRLAGQGETGGVWEWTSTVLEKYEGFEPMELYPGYTADFFDGKHNIVLGGSWATHPRIAGRKTFVNWYQRNYPFVWAGARLVRDD